MSRLFFSAFEGLSQHYQRRRLGVLVIFLVALAGWTFAQFWWATAPRGVGLRTDSVRYLWSAENLARGLGLGRENGDRQFVATTHWPPLYPMLLAGLNAAGLPIDQSARWLAALFAAGCVLVFGLFLYRLSGQSAGAAMLGAGLLAVMPHFWDTALYAMTEAPYLVWTLLAVLFLSRYIETKRRAWLVAAALMQAAAFLTRYVGGALLAACALGLLLIPAWPWRRKIMDAFWMSLIAVAPMIAWFIRNLAYTGAAANRRLELHPISPSEWAAFAAAVRAWLNPLDDLGSITLLRLLTIAVLALGAAGLALHGAKKPPAAATPLAKLTLLATLTYAAMTLAARLLFDPYIPLNEQRILLPFFAGLFALVVYALHRLTQWAARYGAAARAGLTALLIVSAWIFGRAYYKETLLLWNNSRQPGLGLANVFYDRLGFIPQVAAYPREAIYFTDNLDLMYRVLHIPAYQITPSDPDSLARVTQRAAQAPVVVVLFWRDSAPPPVIAGVRLVYDAADGAVYTNIP